MIDTEKLKTLKMIGIGIAALLIIGCLLFWIFGGTSKTKTTHKNNKTEIQQKKKAEGEKITQDYVMEFLTAYFTKKDLGENRNRYLPFMTEGAYQQEINTEDTPAIQTYKGYVVNTKLKSATIYIDSVNNVVLVQVNYTQTQLQKKNDYTNAQTDVFSKSTLRIHYLKQDGKYLVNQIEPILIVDTLTTSQEASIPTLNQPQTEGENKE